MTILCSRLECENEAKWQPILLLVPSRTYAGKPWRMVLMIGICDGCKTPRHDVYMSEELWLQIVQTFKQQGKAPPWRMGTRVEYQPLPDDFELPEGATVH